MVLVGRPDANSHLEDPCVDRKIILKWFFKKCNGKTWTGFFLVRLATGGGRF